MQSILRLRERAAETDRERERKEERSPAVQILQKELIMYISCALV